MSKKALITGVTGQDGSYLAELLITKGYEVHGVRRRSSNIKTDRIDKIYELPHIKSPKFKLHYGDLCDGNSLLRIIKQIKPDEIYNLAAQSHVAVSFENPEYTADTNATGTLRLLEILRNLELHKTKFYQASTSELYGKVQEVPQKESTPFYPRSPYGVSKLYSYWIVKNYREAFGMFACNGILFNHESPRRGETFVTRKITMTLAKIFYGIEDCLYIGNLDAKRDWGHAKDYVEMQWLMLQQDKPDDYVIATGEQHSVREFIEIALNFLGIEIKWHDKGSHEYAKVVNNKSDSKFITKDQVIVKVDQKYLRPSEVETLLGDASKAKKELGWEPKIKFNELVEDMINSDLKKFKS